MVSHYNVGVTHQHCWQGFVYTALVDINNTGVRFISSDLMIWAGQRMTRVLQPSCMVLIKIVLALNLWTKEKTDL